MSTVGATGIYARGDCASTLRGTVEQVLSLIREEAHDLSRGSSRLYMQTFIINQGSTLPLLRVELINDGRYDFMKSYQFNNAIQNASVTFSMYRIDNNKPKIFKAPADIILAYEGTCDERYVLQYRWNKRDVNEKGQFLGKFEITFNGSIKEEGIDYESGNLIVPILEDLDVLIK